jgi:predicted MFS family arabinose efflux permease
VALGTVSLITDISSEMITAVLPVYLVFGLGVSLVSVGVVDGLYAGVTVLVSLLAAHVADRTQRRKAVAAVGYGLSAVSKLGLPAVGASPVASPRSSAWTGPARASGRRRGTP